MAIKPNKQLGQNFLKDKKMLNYEIEIAKLVKTDTVLEIGPGLGNLTELIAQKAGKVIAIETDLQFKPVLEALAKKYDNIQIIWRDALTVKFPRFNKVIANLPFNIAMPLTFKILEHDFNIGILMYQKKMAERFGAKPGKERYSKASVLFQRVAKSKILKVVSRNKFDPEPEVDCALVEVRKMREKFRVGDNFNTVLEYLFFQRNNYVDAALKKLLEGNDSKKVYAAIEDLKLKGIKVNSLRPEEFARIARELNNKKIKVPLISEDRKRKAQKR
jgi:16S rRNA (adenine1518-N6/adenine1519-N6)-dimethyltransferase